jgi:hypothetical protein
MLEDRLRRLRFAREFLEQRLMQTGETSPMSLITASLL